jgi:hypothetical protein
MNTENPIEPENLSLDTLEKRDKSLRKLIVAINWVTLIIFIFSVLATIIYSFFYPDRTIPFVFNDIWCFTVGWFAGGLASFYMIETR